MADHDWLSQYAPAEQTPAAQASGDSDHSWLSGYRPVDQSAAAPASAPQVSGAQAVQNGFEDTLLMGGKDELFAGLDAAAQPLFGTGNEGDTFSDRYSKNLVDQRAFLKASADQHPVLNTVGGVAGAVAPAILTGGGSLAAGGAKASLAAASAKSAAVGAAQGGAYGFGSAEGGVGDRLAGAGEGALVGGLVGGAAPAVISGVGAAARKVIPDRFLPKTGETPAPGSQPGGEYTPASAPETDHADVVGAAVSAANSSGRAQARKIDDLAATVQPDAQVLAAGEKLGISDLPPEFYSQNPAFRQVSSGLASVPSSPMAIAQKAKLDELGNRADQFIRENGGQTDKSAFSDDFRNAGQATLQDLKDASDDLHGQVLSTVPNDTPAYSNNGLDYLNGRLADLNGDTSLLDPVLKKAHKVLTADPDSGKPLVEVAGLKVPERYDAPARSLSSEADQIVSDLGGSYDKAAFSDTYKKQAQDAANQLQDQSDAIYKDIRQAIPGNVRVPATNAVGYVRARQAELGNAQLLNADQRTVLSVLAPQRIVRPKGALFPGQVETVEIHPNYAAVDQVRKEVGQGYKGVGPFASMERGQLDALYGALSRDQEAAVSAAGPELGQKFQQAKALVAQRKGIEEGLTDATGKDLSGAIGSTLGSAITKVAAGDYQLLDRTIAQIPPELRQQAMATGLAHAFSAGKGNGLDIPALTSWYDKLASNPTAMARIEATLPAGSMQRISALAGHAKTLQGLASGQIVDPSIRAPGFATLGSLRADLAARLQSKSLTDDQRNTIQRMHDAILADQGGIADRHGAGAAFQSAIALDAKRGELDANLKGLLGDDLKGSVTAKLGSAIVQLKDGNTKAFDAVIKQIPKEQQGPAVITALNDLFTDQARKAQDLGVAGFSSAYEGLMRNPASMDRLETYMSKDGFDQFKAIGTLAVGIQKAMSEKIHTGRLDGLLKKFDSEGGFIARAFDLAKKAGIAEAVTSSIGFHGVGATSVLIGAFMKKRDPAVEGVTKLLMSPQFKSAVLANVRAGGEMRPNVVAQEKRLMRTMAYRKWEKALSESARARIATVGPLVYLTEPDPKGATAGGR